MPKRKTKHGIQHLPRRRRLPPLHPGVVLALVVAGVVMAGGIMVLALTNDLFRVIGG